MSLICKYCGEKFDNPEIYRIHEDNCLDAQKQNGLLKEDVEEKSLDEMNVQELKELAKERGIEGYSNMKKNELIDILQVKGD